MLITPTVEICIQQLGRAEEMAHNMVNFGPLTAEICWRVCATPANFSLFHVLAVLLHGTVVMGVSQALRR